MPGGIENYAITFNCTKLHRIKAQCTIPWLWRGIILCRQKSGCRDSLRKKTLAEVTFTRFCNQNRHAKLNYQQVFHPNFAGDALLRDMHVNEIDLSSFHLDSPISAKLTTPLTVPAN